MKISTPLIGLVLLSGLMLTGCTTPPKAAAADKTGEDEYVYLPPKTGSNVPRKVKKSDLLAGKIPDADTSSVGTVSAEDYNRSIGHPMRPNN